MTKRTVSLTLTREQAEELHEVLSAGVEDNTTNLLIASSKISRALSRECRRHTEKHEDEHSGDWQGALGHVDGAEHWNG